MLLHECVGPREVAATLADLILKKYLRMQDQALDSGQHDVIFQLLKPEPEWHDLEVHERTLLAQMFRDQSCANLEETKLRVPDVLLAMNDEVAEGLWEKGVYRRPPNTSFGKMEAALYLAAVFIPLWTCVLLGITGAVALVASFSSTGIAWWGIHNTTFWTTKRKELYVHLEGMRDFINAVDADRLRRMERYRFDVLLPYAMVFGIERKWAATLRDLGKERLEWRGDENTDSVLRGATLITLGSFLESVGR